jgi:hypothetical protein
MHAKCAMHTAFKSALNCQLHQPLAWAAHPRMEHKHVGAVPRSSLVDAQHRALAVVHQVVCDGAHEELLDRACKRGPTGRVMRVAGQQGSAWPCTTVLALTLVVLAQDDRRRADLLGALADDAAAARHEARHTLPGPARPAAVAQCAGACSRHARPTCQWHRCRWSSGPAPTGRRPGREGAKPGPVRKHARAQPANRRMTKPRAPTCFASSMGTNDWMRYVRAASSACSPGASIPSWASSRESQTHDSSCLQGLP